ncbi:uncharacterized protein ASPGLDRAFT_42105 [Aspergillus glaucus CBS 516.65]|uniref:Uncharacterized protein n=1 Tax=Aspergillus glaucus CBS 516.65 TaxID=1160497 RepID=A0A1L9VX93_ASPGL|nr:hypothetical protein ASPGLDRAFT_42105 [Aspergillus glaucus CBS 516.65]OJJ88531.1 hypothetical protein ASPGLDRAFT_42105 [Aspergillus glaucus CBS 516.65]
MAVCHSHHPPTIPLRPHLVSLRFYSIHLLTYMYAVNVALGRTAAWSGRVDHPDFFFSKNGV